MSAPLAVCYINNYYPTSYWDLLGVVQIHPRQELWWASRERTAFEDGLPTSEYLELDYGRLRSLNFMNFNILQKPIDITIEYDVWSFESGIKNWQPVTKIVNERFDDRVNYSPNSVNPWKNCQFYFTNVKGDLVSTRYLRLKFDRRDEPWPNGDRQNTFPWSVDVKDLRTSRYVINLNDARGVLVQQGKVTSPIVDPAHYEDDYLTGEPQVEGIISDVEIYTPPVGHDGETYINFMVSSVSSGNEVPGTTGGGGFTVQQVGGDSTIARIRVDANEVGHLAVDLPTSQYNYQFFTPWPTDMYGYWLAVGDLAGVGVNTTTIRTPLPYGTNTGTALTVTGGGGNPTPVAGDLIVVCISIRGTQTVTVPPTDDEGSPYTLVHTGTSPGPVRSYVYKKVATGTEGPIDWTATISGSAQWLMTGVVLGTPSSTAMYVMDEASYVLTHPSDYVAIHTAATHG